MQAASVCAAAVCLQAGPAGAADLPSAPSSYPALGPDAGVFKKGAILVNKRGERIGRENDAPAARLWHLDGGLGPALTTLGVMVLAFTPALRVLALVVVWWHERDWRFVGVALFVVATLAVGILLGRG